MLQTLFESQFKAQIYVQQKYIVTMDLGMNPPATTIISSLYPLFAHEILLESQHISWLKLPTRPAMTTFYFILLLHMELSAIQKFGSSPIGCEDFRNYSWGYHK